MGSWKNLTSDGESIAYTCGYCGRDVAERNGWEFSGPESTFPSFIRICHSCENPTYFKDWLGNSYGAIRQIPGSLPGAAVRHLTDPVKAVYQEARSCYAQSAYTGCVLLLRKLLMHVAMDKGSPKKNSKNKNSTFEDHVNYLNDNGYIPADGRDWVDEIRKVGNRVNHELVVMEMNEAGELLDFTEQLLKNVYELPGRMEARRQARNGNN